MPIHGCVCIEYCADRKKDSEVSQLGDKLFSKVIGKELDRLKEWNVKDLQAFENKLHTCVKHYWLSLSPKEQEDLLFIYFLYI